MNRLLTLIAGLSVAGCVTASAQEAGEPSVVERLAQIPPLSHARPPERIERTEAYVCAGRHYRLSMIEYAVEGADLRRVELAGFETPAGPLSAGDMDRIQGVLRPYLFVFSVRMDCQGASYGLVFEGRRRNDTDNSSIRVWFRGRAITGLSD